MKYFTLNNGVRVPALGYGTYLTPASVAEKNVIAAIHDGYRLIDTSQDYDNEGEVGAGVRHSGVARDEIIFATKVDTDGYKETADGIDESLRRTGLDYLDLMIIHWPRRDDLGTYKALEEAYKAGKIRAIGLSNYNEAETQNIIDHFETVPAINQIETHLYWQQARMHRYLASKGIVHEAWAPLGEGESHMLADPILTKIAREHSKSPAQILLRFEIDSDILVIPKSLNPAHIKDNFDLFDFELTDEDMAALRARDRRDQINGWPVNMRVETQY